MYSDGTFLNSCKKCPPGQAAIPGFYLNTFDDKVIHPRLKQRCLGDSCGNVSIVIPSKKIIKMFRKLSTEDFLFIKSEAVAQRCSAKRCS